MAYKVLSILLITVLTLPCAAQEPELDQAPEQTQERAPTPEQAQTKKGEPIGDLALAAGWMFPQDSYGRFSDDGFTGWLRGNVMFGESHLVSMLISLSGADFGTSSEPVALVADTFVFAGERTVSNYEVSFHMGAQLGTGNRRGFFRPRVAIAPGIYLFNTQTALRLVSDTESLSSNTVMQIRFGWRAIAAGAFTPSANRGRGAWASAAASSTHWRPWTRPWPKTS